MMFGFIKKDFIAAMTFFSYYSYIAIFLNE